MSLKISSLTPTAPLDSAWQTGTAPSSSSFKSVLNSAIQEVASSRAGANQAIQRYLAGDSEDLHSTILASQRADLEFQMFMQIRNKVVSAYEEIMKTQM